MSATVLDEIQRLRSRISRYSELDQRGRKTDAAAHLRQAIDLLEGCARPDPKLSRVAELLVEASDLLTSEAP